MFCRKEERHLAPGAHLDEVRRLQSRLGEEDAVVGDDADEESRQPGEAADERRAVARLELLEARAVHQPRDDLAHVVGLPDVRGKDAVDLFAVVRRLFGLGAVGRQGLDAAQVRDDRPGDLQGVRVVFGQVVGDAGDAGVHVGAAQLLGRDLFARRRLDERRAREKDRAGPLDDDRLVGHRRHVGSAGRARAHDDGDLRNALGRHSRLVVEDPPEVLPVRKDLRLERQEGAARVHEIHAGQAVLLRDLLRSQVLLDRDREVGPSLHGRVVGDHHDLAAGDPADARDEAGARRLSAVHPVRGERRELEKRRARIRERVHALPHEHLLLLRVTLAGRSPLAVPAPSPR